MLYFYFYYYHYLTLTIDIAIMRNDLLYFVFILLYIHNNHQNLLLHLLMKNTFYEILSKINNHFIHTMKINFI